MPTDPILVHICHQDSVVNAGIAAILSQHDEFQLLNNWPADTAPQGQIIIADYDKGISLARQHACWPKSAAPRVLILSYINKQVQICFAVENGVLGYLLQCCHADELILAVRDLSRGVPYLSAAISHYISNSFVHMPLTRREMDVLTLLAEGYCNKTISRELGIGVGTVKIYLKAIMVKLNAKARTHAVVIAARRGLV